LEQFEISVQNAYNPKNRITLRHHIIFWVIYFILNTLRWGSYFNDYSYSFKTNILGFAIHMSLCYLNIYVLMPKFVFKKKYLLYVIILLLSLFAAVLIKFNITYLLFEHKVWPEGPEQIDHLTLNYSVNMMIGELYVIAFVTAIKTTMDWLAEHKRLTDLEKEQMETQLLFLRNQVSPHFFFNTLNNIYSLALEGSKKTPDVILKLSEVMRYLLYETKNKRKSLESELNCIQSYLELEKLRHNENLEIDINISGNTKDKAIAPLLLLSFIENSFKHGANKNIGKVKIKINFEVLDDFLYFSISNPKPAKNIYKKKANSFGGFGLMNVKKRLNLGYNKEDYGVFNLSGYVQGTGGGKVFNGYIAPAQGFFVSAQYSGNVNFNNSSI